MWGTQVYEAPNCVREPSLLGTQVCVGPVSYLAKAPSFLNLKTEGLSLRYCRQFLLVNVGQEG